MSQPANSEEPMQLAFQVRNCRGHCQDCHGLENGQGKKFFTLRGFYFEWVILELSKLSSRYLSSQVNICREILRDESVPVLSFHCLITPETDLADQSDQ